MLTLTARPRPLLLGTEFETGEAVRIMRELLATHFHILGPPGTGKTRLLLWLFEALSADRNATVVLFNFKGDLGHMARDWAIAHGLTKRLLLFDPAEQEAIIGYNPLRPNGLSVATHAKAVREGIRSGWGQASFDETPQLARLLFLALAAVRELGLTLVEAVRLLQPRSAVRKVALRRLRDEYLREALAYFDSLRDTRQEELAASSLARLEAFVNDEHVRRILTQQTRSIDLGRIIAENRVLIVNLEQYKPLRVDDIKLLGRMIVNDLVAHVFARPERARTPVYLMIDELEVFATSDLASALDLGRELKLHCVLAHQYIDQLVTDDPSGALCNSVKKCALTKVVFGGLPVEDLEPIAKEFFIDEYNPLAVKDEIRHLELEPVESRRLSFALNAGVGQNWQNGTAVAHGTSRQTGKGHVVGSSEMSAESDSHSSGTGFAANVGSSTATLPTGEMVNTSSGGTTESSSSLDAHSTMHSSATQENWSSSESQGVHEGQQTSRGSGGGINFGVSLTSSPFYEYIKRWPVASREFWKLEEFLIKFLQILHTLPRGCFAVRVPGQRTLFLRAPRVDKPWLSRGARDRALKQIFAQPYYSTPAQIEAEETARRGQFLVARRETRSTIKEIVPNDDAGSPTRPRRTTRTLPKPPTDRTRR